jgi:hypothetical protein
VRIVLVDYSDSSFSGDARKTALSAISGKFVQVRNKNDEYLVLAPKECASYHADIAERFCREMGLKGYRDGDGKRFTIHDAAWVIAGGGRFELDRRKKYIRLYGNSLAYGRFDSKGLKERISLLPELSTYTADIE